MRPITFKTAYEASTPLPITFIDRYMPVCTPVYALIYIYGLRHSMAGGEALSTQAIGEVFHILETDVLNAWKYWDAQGLVKMDTQGDSLSIEFLPLTEQIVEQYTEKAVEITEATLPKTHSKTFNVDIRPQYTMEELSFYKKQSTDIARLFSHGEQTLAKMLTYHDLNVLFGFYDWLRLPIDVILHLLTYCADGDHRDLRYVEKVALDWAERGINTVEAAREYTQTFDGDFRAVMKALGHPSAFPSPTQRKYMQKWLNEMEIPLDLVLEACDKTAVQLGKPKLTYIDKIIADWYKKGIKSLDGVAAAEADWHKAEKTSEDPERRRADKTTKQRRNRFANFTPRERDYAQIERMEREYLLKSIEG